MLASQSVIVLSSINVILFWCKNNYLWPR